MSRSFISRIRVREIAIDERKEYAHPDRLSLIATYQTASWSRGLALKDSQKLPQCYVIGYVMVAVVSRAHSDLLANVQLLALWGAN